MHSKESKNEIFTSFDFFQVAQTQAFADKTLLIEEILAGHKNILITELRKFSKCTNLSMLKRCLSVASKNTTEVIKTFKKIMNL